MAFGTVKWFSDKRGYGFIEQDSGENIFVHYSGIDMDGYKKLDEGDRVTFEIESGRKGPAARNVKKL